MAVFPVEELRQLILGGESFTVEFKGEERAALGDTDLVEAVVCLANGAGGVLLVGVEDDGRVTGARPRHRLTTDPLRLQALIQARTVPPVVTDCAVVRIDGKDVVVIRVPRMERAVATSAGRYLRRAMGADGRPRCVPFFQHEMTPRPFMGGLDYTALALPGAGWDELDPLEFERARQVIRRHRGDPLLLELDDLEMAKALGAVEANGEVRQVTVAGMLLFGREEAIARRVPTHEVAFQVLVGTRVELNEFFRWPLIRLSEELAARYAARRREHELQHGPYRVPLPEYDERSFREAVHNALIHRDYARPGAVYVQWHRERIEVANPGGLPQGVRLDNLLVTPPAPRNPRLADAFKRLGLVERTGRGVDIIFEGCLRSGHGTPEYGQSTEDFVKVILPGGEPDEGFVRRLLAAEKAGSPLAIEELLVARAARDQGRIRVDEAARLLQRSVAVARAVLQRLEARGLVQPVGQAADQAYCWHP